MARPLGLSGEAPPPARGVPPLAAKGFRPFFLLAAAFAACILPVWMLSLAGVLSPDAYLDPTYWHAHEMVFGYAVAVIAGFLLTAVGNWTGRETATGAPLVVLGAVWLAGRLAFALPHVISHGLVAVLDLAFLPALAVAIGRPNFAAKNRRNYPIVGVVMALWLADLAVHLDALGVLVAWRKRASLVAVDLVVLLIMFLAARIFPMFTRNATKVQSIRNVPALDWAAMGAMLAVLLSDLLLPGSRLGSGLCAATAALALARSATWGAHHSLRVPLLWILHAAHLWIPIGLVLRALSALTYVVPPSSALHALTVGAIGSATLGMMARVGLGHTGRALEPPKIIAVAFLLLTLAAVVRVAGPFALALYRPSLYVAGSLWTAAFVAYVVVYAPILSTPRPDGKPG